MCQQGSDEIYHTLRVEKEELHQQWEAYERGEIELTDEDLKTMAVRMMMIRDALY